MKRIQHREKIKGNEDFFDASCTCTDVQKERRGSTTEKGKANRERAQAFAFSMVTACEERDRQKGGQDMGACAEASAICAAARASAGVRTGRTFLAWCCTGSKPWSLLEDRGVHLSVFWLLFGTVLHGVLVCPTSGL